MSKFDALFSKFEDLPSLGYAKGTFIRFNKLAEILEETDYNKESEAVYAKG